MRFILPFLFIFNAHAADPDCGIILAAPSSSTEMYIAYLENLIEQRLIAIEKLRALEQMPTVNPLLGSKESIVRMHARALQEFIDDGSLDPRAITAWAHAKANAQATVADERDQTRQDTDLLPKIATNRMGKSEIMNSLVTQRQWTLLMDANPSAHVDHLDLPVENMTWFEAIEFANHASELEGLSPYYQIEGEGVDRLRDANGFRLPKSKEIITVMMLAVDGEVIWNPDKYLWSANNSGGRTQIANKLQPFKVNGQEYFDLLGNVSVLTDDMRIAGPSFENIMPSPTEIPLDCPKVEPDQRNPHCGIRLVRKAQ